MSAVSLIKCVNSSSLVEIEFSIQSDKVWVALDVYLVRLYKDIRVRNEG